MSSRPQLFIDIPNKKVPEITDIRPIETEKNIFQKILGAIDNISCQSSNSPITPVIVKTPHSPHQSKKYSKKFSFESTHY